MRDMVVRAEVTSRRAEVFRNYGEKYAAFIQPLAGGGPPVVLRRGSRAAVYFQAVEENQRLSRKPRHLYQVKSRTTCTSVLCNYLRYCRLE